MIKAARRRRIQDVENINNIFYCKKCEKNVTVTPLWGKHESDTPVGTIRADNAVAYCPDCGKELNNNSMNNFNSLIMSFAAVAEWRKQNPNGTKKQCRRALGMFKDGFDQLWEAPEELTYEVVKEG